MKEGECVNKRQRKKAMKKRESYDLKALGQLTKTINNYQRKKAPTNCSENAIECGTDCHEERMTRRTERNKFARLKELDERLPSLRSTTESFVNLTLAKNFVSRTSNEVNEDLDRFLETINLTDETNYDTLHQGLVHALIYGRAGFRFLSKEEGFVFVPSDRYTVVYQENEEHLVTNEVLGYIIARPNTGTPFGENYEIDKEMDFTLRDLINNPYGYNDQYIYVTKENFYNFHFYGDAINNDSPLNHDLERIELFLELVTQLKLTVKKANGEVTLVKLVEDLFNLNSKQVSELVTSSRDGKNAQHDSVLEQAMKFVDMIADATGRKALLVSPTTDDVDILKASVSISDFTSLYDYIETFISKLYGLSQNVLTLDSMPRDASANPIFEQMMKTSVYPKRKLVAQFINNFICKRFNWDFVRYEEESYAVGLEATNAQVIANIIATLNNAGVEPKTEIVDELIYKPLLKNKTKRSV